MTDENFNFTQLPTTMNIQLENRRCDCLLDYLGGEFESKFKNPDFN